MKDFMNVFMNFLDGMQELATIYMEELSEIATSSEDADEEDFDDEDIIEEDSDDEDAVEEDFDDEDESLWDNPPPKAETWPNVSVVPTLWNSPPVKAASWPNVSMPDSVAAVTATFPPSASVNAGVATSASCSGGCGGKSCGSNVMEVTPSQTTNELVEPDNRGRICIPAKYVQEIGLKPGMHAYIAPRRNSQYGFVVLRWAPNTGTFHVYKVDKDSNLRISKYLIQTYHIAGRAVNVKADRNRVVVW